MLLRVQSWLEAAATMVPCPYSLMVVTPTIKFEIAPVLCGIDNNHQFKNYFKNVFQKVGKEKGKIPLKSVKAVEAVDDMVLDSRENVFQVHLKQKLMEIEYSINKHITWFKQYFIHEFH